MVSLACFFWVVILYEGHSVCFAATWAQEIFNVLRLPRALSSPQRPSFLEMTKLAHRRYGNFPQRRATLLPRAAKRRAQFALEAMSSLWFSVSNLATTVAVRHTKEQVIQKKS